MKTIKRNDKNDDVKYLQQLLQLKPDGVFGPITELVVKEFQQQHNLTPDGIVGPKTWQVLINESKKEKTKIHVILDYGHGAATNGKKSPLYKTLPVDEQNYFKQYQQFGTDRFYEYLFNRVTGRKIADTLRSMNITVHEIISKNEDKVDISLSERVRRTNSICNKYGAGNCLFISIHSNAAGNGTKWMQGRGWSAYTTKGKTKSDEFATILYKYADKYFKRDNQKIRKDMSDNDPDQESNFTVIYGAKCPSVLTESFFYDNINDLKYLVSKQGQQAIVNTHVDAICEYIK